MPSHDAGLRLAAKLVAAGATDDEILRVFPALLPKDYSGNSLEELPGWIKSAREKGFDHKSGRGLPLDEAIARQVATELEPLVFVHGDGFLKYANGFWSLLTDRDIDRRAKDLLLPYVSKGAQVASKLPNVRSCLALNVERDGFGIKSNFICLQNGTLNVETGELEPHLADHEARFQLPFDYDPEATCPLYDEHIRYTLCDDDKRIGLFDEFAGLTLIPDLCFQKAVYLVGPGGSGKSTLLRLVRAMHDPRAISVTPLDKIDRERYLTDLARKLVCISFDIQTGDKVFGEAFIRVTGGDPVAVRRLYQEVQGMVTPTVRFLGSMNPDMPKVAGAPDALQRRLIFLECNDPVDDPRANYEAGLHRELPGIFVRWVRALQRLYARGEFDIPETSLIAVKAYLFEEEPFDIFFADELIIDLNAHTRVAEIHEAFNLWAKDHNEATLTSNIVGRKLRRLGVKGGFARHASGEASRTARTVRVRFRAPKKF